VCDVILDLLFLGVLEVLGVLDGVVRCEGGCKADPEGLGAGVLSTACAAAWSAWLGLAGLGVKVP